MATVNAVATNDASGCTVVWAGIGNGSQGAPPTDVKRIGAWRQASFQVAGTFGMAGSVSLEGSNDGTTWVALSPAALTAAGFFAALGIMEHPRFIRPNVTAGDGTTSLTVTGYFS
jgi:hypothetical protein